jgi:hypothetical protein
MEEAGFGCRGGLGEVYSTCCLRVGRDVATRGSGEHFTDRFSCYGIR